MWHVTVFLLHFRKHNERLGWSDDEERQLGAEKEKKIHRARWSDRQSSDQKKSEKKSKKRRAASFFIPSVFLQLISPPLLPLFPISISRRRLITPSVCTVGVRLPLIALLVVPFTPCEE